MLFAAAAGLASGAMLSPAEEAAAGGRTFIGGPAVASVGTPGAPSDLAGRRPAGRPDGGGQRR